MAAQIYRSIKKETSPRTLSAVSDTPFLITIAYMDYKDKKKLFGMAEATIDWNKLKLKNLLQYILLVIFVLHYCVQKKSPQNTTYSKPQQSISVYLVWKKEKECPQQQHT